LPVWFDINESVALVMKRTRLPHHAAKCCKGVADGSVAAAVEKRHKETV
jgi:hypothetical protein